MSFETDLEARSAAIEEQARIIETCADPATRSAALELLRSVMELHKSALERILTIAQARSDLIEELASDPAVHSILMLYDLHPHSLEVRVRRALDDLQKQLQRQRAEVKLINVKEGAVHVRLSAAQQCGSDPATLESLIRRALTDAAPDAEIVVEAPSQNFVPLDALQPKVAAAIKE
jgi:Fe-S cluster biogenesis protein NfuA